jgi:hypothetical protein
MKGKSEDINHDESRELKWPDGQPRTRIQDRESRNAWKLPMAKVKEGLQKELERSGATSSLTTYSMDAREPGVAVYFSRKAQNEFAWQEALGFIGELPTVDQIKKSYMRLAQKCHPDGPTPDAEMFRSITAHRDRAIDFVTGRHSNDHEYVIAIDVFDEMRLNLNAVKVVLYSLRRIEDCGSPLMLERAFRGFAKALTTGTGGSRGNEVA